MSHVVFELYKWKLGRKTFALNAILQKNDFAGWNDYYKIEFKHGNKTVGEYRGRRFSGIYEKERLAFENVMSNHPAALQEWMNFHWKKIDIASRPVLFCF